MKIVQDADAIYREGAEKAGVAKDIGQYFAHADKYALSRSSWVMREHMITQLRLERLTTVDFMTAESAEIPWEVLEKVMNRIMNEVSCESSTV
ncbi:MAG: hypothetical protein ACLTUL_20305 [Blautia faecis]